MSALKGCDKLTDIRCVIQRIYGKGVLRFHRCVGIIDVTEHPLLTVYIIMDDNSSVRQYSSVYNRGYRTVHLSHGTGENFLRSSPVCHKTVNTGLVNKIQRFPVSTRHGNANIG